MTQKLAFSLIFQEPQLDSLFKIKRSAIDSNSQVEYSFWEDN